MSHDLVMTRGARRSDARTSAQRSGTRPSRGSTSMSASVWIINLVVLGVVLEADLGRRKITWFRLTRPVLVAGAIIIYYLRSTPVATSGGGLAFELGLAA